MIQVKLLILILVYILFLNNKNKRDYFNSNYDNVNNKYDYMYLMHKKTNHFVNKKINLLWFRFHKNMRKKLILNKKEWDPFLIKIKLLVLSNKKFKNQIELESYIYKKVKKINGDWRKDGTGYTEALKNTYEVLKKKDKKRLNKKIKEKFVIEHFDINKELKQKTKKMLIENKRLYKILYALESLLYLHFNE